MFWYQLIISIAAAYFLCVTLINVVYFKRKTQHLTQPLEDAPFVSILVPVRNEEKLLEKCLISLLEQDYPNYEVLVINDGSTDGSGAILQKLQQKYNHLRVFDGKPLDPSWYGKPHALQQLLEHAKGEYFLFTDADTQHTPQSLAFSIHNMQYYDLDLLSGYPFESLKNFGDVLNVGAMYLMTTIVLPLPLIDWWKWNQTSFCIGQYFTVKASSFKEINGFESVKKFITEDIALAKVMKKNDYKTKFIDAQNYVSCHMYHSYAASFMGIGKNVYDTVGRYFIRYWAVTILIFGVIWYPIVQLILDAFAGNDLNLLLVLTIALYSGSNLANTIDRRLPWYACFVQPLQFLTVWAMATYFVVTKWFGRKVKWKDRELES